MNVFMLVHDVFDSFIKNEFTESSVEIHLSINVHKTSCHPPNISDSHCRLG